MRTLYACMAENDGELSFEPNQIITNGKSNKLLLIVFQCIVLVRIFKNYVALSHSETIARAWVVGGHSKRQDRLGSKELCRAVTMRL